MKRLLICVIFFGFILNAQPLDFKHINFDKADSIAYALQGARLNNLPFLAHQLTHSLNTQVEQFRAIHTWVCSNIEADHYFGDKTIRKRKKFKNDSIAFANWNKEALSGLFKRLVADKKTICSGYSYLIKQLSSFVDIPCEIVDGYSRTINTNLHELDIPNHSWNAVQLDNKWYLVDATLASGFYFVNENVFIKDYNDGYFLADPKLFAKNHYPLDKKWLLLDQKPTLEEFIKTPLIYGKTFKHKVVPMSPNQLVTHISEGEVLEFHLKVLDAKKIEDIVLEISGGLKYDKVKASTEHYKNGIVNFEYNFTKRGRYDVHIKVRGDVVVSFVVHVDRPSKKLS